MQSITIGFALLLSFSQIISVLAQITNLNANSDIVSLSIQAASIRATSLASVNTIFSEPACAGCNLNALSSELTFSAPVSLTTTTSTTTVPASVRVTWILPDGCTSTEITRNNFSATTTTPEHTWSTLNHTLVWPTTYTAYTSFNASSLRPLSGGSCFTTSTTISVPTAIIYTPSSTPVASLTEIPTEVVESIFHDGSIPVPFNFLSCDAKNGSPGASSTIMSTLSTSRLPSPLPTPRMLAPKLGIRDGSSPSSTFTVTVVSGVTVTSSIGNGPMLPLPTTTSSE